MTDQPPAAPDTKPQRPWQLTSLPVIIVFAWVSGAMTAVGILLLMSDMSPAIGLSQIAVGVAFAMLVIIGYRDVRHRYSTKPGRANSPQ